MSIEELKQKIWEIEARIKWNKSGLHRARIEREIPCDTDVLYGPLDKAITYLESIKRDYPSARLDENWTGYEEMYMRFVWTSEQTDEEYKRSLEAILWDRQCKEQNFDVEKIKKLKQIELLEKQLAALKGK